jgi:hypothetical protein
VVSREVTRSGVSWKQGGAERGAESGSIVPHIFGPANGLGGGLLVNSPLLVAEGAPCKAIPPLRAMLASTTGRQQAVADIAASFQSVATQHLCQRVRRGIGWARDSLQGGSSAGSGGSSNSSSSSSSSSDGGSGSGLDGSAAALRHLVVAGGVASNQYIRQQLAQVRGSGALRRQSLLQKPGCFDHQSWLRRHEHAQAGRGCVPCTVRPASRSHKYPRAHRWRKLPACSW